MCVYAGRCCVLAPPASPFWFIMVLKDILQTTLRVSRFIPEVIYAAFFASFQACRPSLNP